MNPKRSTDSRTKLDEETFTRCMGAALAFLETNPSIRNSKLREITGIDYDEAIRFLNRAVREEFLVRRGQSSGIHYILPNQREK